MNTDVDEKKERSKQTANLKGPDNVQREPCHDHNVGRDREATDIEAESQTQSPETKPREGEG